MITIDDLAELMGKTRKEIEDILKTSDIIELNLKDDKIPKNKDYRLIKEIKW